MAIQLPTGVQHMKLSFKSILSALACALLYISTALAQDAPKQETHGIAASHVDTSVKPGDDFYHYANGTWLKSYEIPPDRASVGVFSLLDDVANKRTAALIEEVAKSNPKPGTGSRKIADLFNAFMDEAGIEAKGLAPLKPHLAAIAAIKDKKQLARALGESMRADVDALNNTNFHTNNIFGLWVAPGFEDSDHYNAYLMQGGIQLPDRDYYLSDTPHMKDLRAKYQPHISAMLKLAGFTDTDTRATRIFGGANGDGTFKFGRTTYKTYAAYKAAVAVNVFATPDTANPRLITDAQFAGN